MSDVESGGASLTTVPFSVRRLRAGSVGPSSDNHVSQDSRIVQFCLERVGMTPSS